MINGDFEDDVVSDQRYGMTYPHCPTGWSCSCRRACYKPVRNYLGRIIVVGSTDKVWGGGKAPSGNNFVSIQSIHGHVNYIEQAIGSASKAFIVHFYARARPNKHRCRVVLQVSYCEISQWTQPLLSVSSQKQKWSRYSVTISPVCASGSTALRFTEVTADQDCTAQIDDVKLMNTSY